ncbi:MAG: ankyrin repeat domain-containing protein [Burkholderiales bacterium]
MNFMRNFRFAVYILVIVCISSFAGSFEDFFIAVKNDNAGTVFSLLQRGFDPNTRDEKGQTGLVMAMQEGSLKAADVLLSHPAIEIDELNRAGESALMMAALKGEVAGARKLLSRGAKVNQPGWSALHYAAAGSEVLLVRLLMEKGADVNAASPNGSTPLMMAAQYGSEDSVKLLLAGGADPKLRNQRDLLASDFARLAGRDNLAKSLGKLER